MPHILCIETTTDICSVAIFKGDEELIHKDLKEFRHSSHLLPLILDALNESNLHKKDLDAICLSEGPGSYTGLRVGASTVKGLAFALDIPLIAINTLKSLANALIKIEHLKDDDTIIMPMIDARRDEVYTAQYNVYLNCIMPTKPLILNEEFSTLIKKGQKVYLCGNGAFKAKEISLVIPNVTIIPTESSAQNLGSLAYDSFIKKEYVNLDHFEPNYLKPPKVTKPKSLFLKRTN